MKLFSGILIAGCLAALSSPLRADTILSILPSPVIADIGAVGDAFDIVLTNSGPGSITIGGFSFEVSVTDPDITLTGADFSPALLPYIFAGHSLDQDLSVPLNFTSGATLDANDSYDIIGSGFTLGANQEISLGEIFFNISPTATPGSFAISFTGGSDANNLSDQNGNTLTVSTLSNGTIDITPEPSSFLLMLAGGAFLARRIAKQVSAR